MCTLLAVKKKNVQHLAIKNMLFHVCVIQACVIHMCGLGKQMCPGRDFLIYALLHHGLNEVKRRRKEMFVRHLEKPSGSTPHLSFAGMATKWVKHGPWHCSTFLWQTPNAKKNCNDSQWASVLWVNLFWMILLPVCTAMIEKKPALIPEDKRVKLSAQVTLLWQYWRYNISGHAATYVLSPSSREQFQMICVDNLGATFLGLIY